MEGLQQVLFRVAENEDLGKHLVALRDLEPGDLIFTEYPSAQGPADYQGSCCIVCCLNNTKDVCQRCWWPVCTECTETEMHKAECRLLSSCVAKGPSFVLPSYLLIYLRTLLLKADSIVWEQIVDLGNHGLQSIPFSDHQIQAQTLFHELFSFIREDCGMNSSVEDVMTVYKAVLSSSLEAKSGGRNLAGVYPMAGLMAQSCLQNTRIVLKGKIPKLHVYASTSIKRGSPLTHSRIQEIIGKGTEERKKLLREQLLDCLCQRCRDPGEMGAHTSSISCQKCSGLCVPLNPGAGTISHWECTQCSQQISKQFVDTLIFTIKSSAADSKASRLERHLKFRSENSQILSENHYLQIAEKARLFLQFSKLTPVGEWLEKVQAGKDLLHIADLLDPGLSIFRESILVNLATCLQLMLSEQIVKRQMEDDINDNQLLDVPMVCAAFRDALVCLREARKAAELETDSDIQLGSSPVEAIDSNINILNEMRQYFDTM